jgi:uncharacterized protein (TIGR03083 family)
VIPNMTWTVAGTVAHIARTALGYAVDAVAGPRELAGVDLEVGTGTAADLIAAVRAGATLLAAAVDAMPPGARGWHPLGLADAGGFAAMGCDEILVHTGDAARGLGVPFDPPPALAERTLRRLFPWAPGSHDPWAALLWANGRGDLPGEQRLDRWRWHCAPLEEWDGLRP